MFAFFASHVQCT